MNTIDLRTLFGIALLSLLFLHACEQQPFRQGKILYENFCANCHMDDGSGLEGLIPPLAGADFVRDKPGEAACIIRHGLVGPVVVNGRTYNQPMAGIPQLSDFEITNVINYIRHAWSNDYGYVKLETVQAALEECNR